VTEEERRFAVVDLDGDAARVEVRPEARARCDAINFGDDGVNVARRRRSDARRALLRNVK
jgi:hypothetical protein